MADLTTDPTLIARIEASFAKQAMMTTLGARLVRVAPGEVEIAMPASPHLSQQHGFVHAGAVATIADSAAGYAGLTIMPAGSGILTAEFKIKAGRTLTLAMAEVFAVTDGKPKLCAMLTATLMAITAREGVSD
jgi:uncharacterized protein (TIGR00369 family)